MLKSALHWNIRVFHGVVLLLTAALLAAALHGVCPLLFQGQSHPVAADCTDADASTSESHHPSHSLPEDCPKQYCLTLPVVEDHALVPERLVGSTVVVWVSWVLSFVFPILPLRLGLRPPNLPPPRRTIPFFYRFCSLLN
jgi:hypothetical protein